MPEAKLKELQSFERNEERKREDIESIENRLGEKRFFDWKIPTVVVSIVMIFMVLLITQPELPTSTQTAAGDELEIDSLYITQGKFTPTSRLYAGAYKVKDDSYLNELEELLNGAQLVHKGEAETSIFFYRVRLNLDSGETKDLNYYITENEEVFYEASTGNAYALSTEIRPHNLYLLLYKMQEEHKLSFWWVLFPCLFLFIAKYDERRMLKETGLNNKPPVDSSKWQSVIRIVFTASLVVMIAVRGVYAMHYLAFIAPATLFFVLYTLIEKKGENNNWRIRNTLWYLLFTMSLMSIAFYGFL